MRWVRIRSEFARFPGGGPAPRFDISSDDDGVANVEIAVRPELLAAPVSSDPPEFFSSLAGSRVPSVAGAELRLRDGRATWVLPEPIWQLWAQLDHTRLWFRVVASSQRSGTPVFASSTNEDCLRGVCDSLGVLPLSAFPPVDPVTIAPTVLDRLGLWERLLVEWIAARGGTTDHRVLAEIVDHPTFSTASEGQQAQVLGVFALTTSPGRADVLRLLDTDVQVGSGLVEPAIFIRDQRNEGTTVEHLLGLRDARLHRRVRARRAQILREALREIVDPGLELNQGNVGTCTATCLSVYTVARNPAEFARWLRHLFDADHRYRCRLARRGFLRLNTQAFSRTAWPSDWAGFLRTYSERVLQAALMDYGNFRMRYDPSTDRFVDWLGQVAGGGLWEFEVSHLLEDLFEQPFVWNFGGGTRSAPNRQQATTDLFGHFAGGGLPAIVHMRWGSGAHAVVGLRVEGDDLIVRNPQYRGAAPVAPDGTAMTSPTRRIHRANRAEEAVPRASLVADLIGFVTESGEIGDFGFTLSEIPDSLQSTVQPTNP